MNLCNGVAVMQNEAVISTCGRYRYLLTRQIKQLEDNQTDKICLFIMLNPSTADANVNDPTIRKCIKFALREKCTRLHVVNLFPFRATNPRKLRSKAVAPIGGDHNNYLIVRGEILKSDLIIVAWGNNLPYVTPVYQVADFLRDAEKQAYCFELTLNGNPKHPLYVRDDQPLLKLSTNLLYRCGCS